MTEWRDKCHNCEDGKGRKDRAHPHFTQSAERIEDRSRLDSPPSVWGLCDLVGLRDLDLPIGWRAVDLLLQRIQSEPRGFDAVGECRLIGSRAGELRLHLGDVLALPGDDLAVSIILGAIHAVGPHAHIELVLHDAFAGSGSHRRS